MHYAAACMQCAFCFRPSHCGPNNAFISIERKPQWETVTPMTALAALCWMAVLLHICCCIPTLSQNEVCKAVGSTEPARLTESALLCMVAKAKRRPCHAMHQ